ncbi:MAG: EamA family transporter, partial [Candidatus Diapherotrites archaeon]
MDRGSLYVILATVLFSTQPIWIKLASQGLPGLLMFSLRFLGTLFVFIPLAFHFRKEVSAEIRQWKKFVVPAFFIFGAVSLFAIGIYFTEDATLTGLLSRSNVIFIGLFSIILFPEERKVLASKTYLAGLALASIGMFGIVAWG